MGHDLEVELRARLQALVRDSRQLIDHARHRRQDQHRYASAATQRARERSVRTVNAWAGAHGLPSAGERLDDDVLGLVLDTARAQFGGCGSISLTTVDQLGGDHDRCRTAASTGIAEAVDGVQYERGEGPCIDAVELDMVCVVRADDLAAVDDALCWPRAAEAMVGLGVRSVLSISVPWSAGHVGLHAERRSLGAINFYAPEEHAFGQSDAHAEMFGSWSGSILSGQEPAAIYHECV